MTSVPGNIGLRLANQFDRVVRREESQHISLAGHSIELRHSSPLSQEAFGTAFSHLATGPSAADAVFRIGLGEGFFEGDRALAELVGRPAESDGLRITEIGATSLMVEHAGIVWWDSENRQGGTWLWSESPELARRASPLLNLVDVWGASVDLPVVHCAAVGTPEKMIVLGAPGGSGKSTLAVAALQRGMAFCGDDYCLIDSGEAGPATVHSLFATAKLDGASQALVPDSADFRRLSGLAENGRSVLELSEHPGVVRSGEVVSVVTPRRVSGAESRLVEVSAGEALRSTAVTSAMLLPYSRPLVLGRVAAMCRSVPCYRLEIGNDLGAAVETIETLLT